MDDIWSNKDPQKKDTKQKRIKTKENNQHNEEENENNFQEIRLSSNPNSKKLNKRKIEIEIHSNYIQRNIDNSSKYKVKFEENNQENDANHPEGQDIKEDDIELENDELYEKFNINIKKFGEEIFDLFVTEISKKLINPIAIDVFEMQNLLDIIGIRKNEFEINCSLKKIRGEKPKSFKYEEKYTKENFLDVIESFLEFRIEDKFLVEIFRKIDLEENGLLNLVKLQEVSRNLNLNFSNEEMIEMLEFFDMDKYLTNKISGNSYQNFKSNFDFQKFCKLYYQGG